MVAKSQTKMSVEPLTLGDMRELGVLNSAPSVISTTAAMRC
jgi:hypothetical protein